MGIKKLVRNINKLYYQQQNNCSDQDLRRKSYGSKEHNISKQFSNNSNKLESKLSIEDKISKQYNKRENQIILDDRILYKNEKNYKKTVREMGHNKSKSYKVFISNKDYNNVSQIQRETNSADNICENSEGGNSMNNFLQKDEINENQSFSSNRHSRKDLSYSGPINSLNEDLISHGIALTIYRHYF